MASVCSVHYVMCNVHSAHNKFLLKFVLCEFDGFNRECESKITNIVLPFFFKSNCNPDNKFFLVIPPKFLAMPSFEASSNDSKVASNSKSKHSNLVV